MKVLKTIKLYIGGQFPRTESGRSTPLLCAKTGNEYARICQSSRKDFRNAVEEAKKAFPSWSQRAAYNKGQIVYRMAEMLEGKRVEFVSLFEEVLGMTNSKAEQEVTDAIDELIHFAGWCDKFQQVTGSINPVNGPFHNFTTPSAMGVVTLIDNDKFSFKELMSNIAAIISSGNTVIVLHGKDCPAVLAPLAEVIATSDMPAGVVNLLTGDLEELYKDIGSHMDVHGISFQNENKTTYQKMQTLGVSNLKRMIPRLEKATGLDRMMSTVEMTTVWHPIGM